MGSRWIKKTIIGMTTYMHNPSKPTPQAQGSALARILFESLPVETLMAFDLEITRLMNDVKGTSIYKESL
jgi:hypothetical protein